MVNLIAVLLVPVAVILSDTLGGGSPFVEYNEGRAAWANFGTCFFGVILASLFGLPLILYHVGSLSATGLGLWLGSTVLTFVASVRADKFPRVSFVWTPAMCSFSSVIFRSGTGLLVERDRCISLLTFMTFLFQRFSS